MNASGTISLEMFPLNFDPIPWFEINELLFYLLLFIINERSVDNCNKIDVFSISLFHTFFQILGNIALSQQSK